MTASTRHTGVQKWILGALLFSTASTFGAVGWFFQTPQREFTPWTGETFRSPQGTYEVTIRGATRFFLPNARFVAVASARTQGKSLVDGLRIYEADFMDTSFRHNFREHLWPREDVLQFVSAGVQHQKDQLSIENRAGSVLSFVKVHAEDLVLALDVPVGVTVSFDVTGVAPYSDVYVYGEAGFGENRRLSDRRGVFMRDGYAGPLRYTVIVSEDSIDVRFEPAEVKDR